MARPPRLLGTIPHVTADWQWTGHWPVTTDALLTGAWRLPKEKKLVLLLVNVSDEPIQATLALDTTGYDLPAGSLTLTRIGPDGPGETRPVPSGRSQRVRGKPGLGRLPSPRAPNDLTSISVLLSLREREDITRSVMSTEGIARIAMSTEVVLRLVLTRSC
jgi:hypothetical protein